MCVEEGVPDDYKGLGLVDHMSSGDRGVCVCVCVCVGSCICVYRHASAGLSIHVNTSKMPEGAGVCYAARVALKKIRKLKEVSDVLEKNFHSNQVKASN